MIFKSLSIRNFLSLIEVSLTFTPGVHYINGINHDMGVDDDESNGAGKSAIFQAIHWCFFGTLPGERAKLNADDVINDQEEKNCRVHQVVELNGQQFDIVRSRKDEEYGTGLRFWVDGEEKTKHTQPETEKRLAELLPITESIFLHAIQVGQGMPDRFIKLSEADKHGLICKIIDLSVYEKAHQTAKNRQSEESLQSKVEEAAVRELESQHEQVTASIEKATAEMETYRNQEAPDLEQIKAQSDALSARYSQLEASIIALAAQVASEEEATAKMDASNQELITETQALGGAASRKDLDVKGRYTDLMRLKEDIDRLTDDLGKLRSEDPQKCPMCKQSISDRSALDVHIGEVNDQLTAKTEAYNVRLAEYTPIQADLAPLQEQYKAKLAESEGVVVGLRDSRIATDRLRNQVTTQRAAQTAALHERDRLTSESARHEQALAAIRGRIEQSKETLAAIEAEHTIKDNLRAESLSKWMHWKFWVQEIPNLRSQAIAAVLQYLNTRVAEYLNYLTSGTLGLELYQEAHGKGMRIKARVLGEKYAAASGGQQKRIDLSLFLALSDLLQHASGFNTNIFVCDEIMDGLSPPGVRRWLELLRQKAQQGASIFVISHNPVVSQVFPFDSIHTIERRGRRATHRLEGALLNA